MNNVDKISKSVFSLFDYAKDSLKNILVSQNSSGGIVPPLSEAQLQKIFSLIDVSASQSFQRGILAFQREIDKIFQESNTKKKS